MNPLLEKRFAHTRSQIEALRAVLEANRADVVQQHAEKEDLLQQQWRERKRLTTLNRIAEDYDGLDEQNRAYAQERKAIHERLSQVLKLTKALHSAHRP